MTILDQLVKDAQDKIVEIALAEGSDHERRQALWQIMVEAQRARKEIPWPNSTPKQTS